MLSVQNLSIRVINNNPDDFNILRDVSFDLDLIGVTGILGESGSGKSILAKAISGLIAPPVTITGGNIIFNGEKLDTPKSFEKVRGGGISMIFQHPTSALNPVFTVGEQLIETILFHKKANNKKSASEMAAALLKQTGIVHPAERMHTYPHQLSGGMNQRIMIALAIATNPRLLIADEPTTALDVITQKQIITLLVDLSKAQNFAILFITHNMLLMEKIADNILVFYAGEMIEIIKGVDLRNGSIRHPCTLALKKCLPALSPSVLNGHMYTIPGQIAKNTDEFAGKCIFSDRCDYAQDRCRREKPQFTDRVKCFYPLQE